MSREGQGRRGEDGDGALFWGGDGRRWEEMR